MKKILSIVGICAGVAFGGLFAESSEAHNALVSSSPAANENVTQQPGQIVITSNEDVLDLGGGRGNAMQISGPEVAPRFYGDGCVQIEGASVKTTAELGQAGTYLVAWQITSTDGHPVSGEYTFEWAPAANVKLNTGADNPPTCNGTLTPISAAAPAPSSTATATQITPGKGASDTNGALNAILWIAGGVAVLMAAVVVIVLVFRRRAVGDASPPSGGSSSGDDKDDELDDGGDESSGKKHPPR